MKKIRALVKAVAPQAQETISYRMPAFRQGRVFIYFAAFSEHIGIYPPVKGSATLDRALRGYRQCKGQPEVSAGPTHAVRPDPARHHRAETAVCEIIDSMSKASPKERNTMQRITPFLWFDDTAEEAANHLWLGVQQRAHHEGGALRPRPGAPRP